MDDDRRGQKRRGPTDSDDLLPVKRSLLVTWLGSVGQLLLLPGSMIRRSIGRMFNGTGDSLDAQVEQPLQQQQTSRPPTIHIHDTDQHFRVRVGAAGVVWWPAGLTAHREDHVLVIRGQFTAPSAGEGVSETVQFSRNLLMPDSCEGGLIRMEAAQEGVDIIVSKIERYPVPGGYADEPDQFRLFLNLTDHRPNRLTVARRGHSLVIRKRFVEERQGHRIKTRSESVVRLPPGCAGNAMVPHWEDQQRRLSVIVPKSWSDNDGPETDGGQREVVSDL